MLTVSQTCYRPTGDSSKIFRMLNVNWNAKLAKALMLGSIFLFPLKTSTWLPISTAWSDRCFLFFFFFFVFFCLFWKRGIKKGTEAPQIKVLNIALRWLLYTKIVILLPVSPGSAHLNSTTHHVSVEEAQHNRSQHLTGLLTFAVCGWYYYY